jgi:hypothetical protein
MSQATFVSRVIDAVERATTTLPNVLGYVELRIAVGKLREESTKEHRPLSVKEDQLLRELAVERLKNDDGGLVLDLAAIIANGCASKGAKRLETLLSIDYWPDKSECPHPFEIVASLLDEIGAFEDGECPLYYDRGRLGIGTSSARKGALLLTNKRLFCVGFFSGFMGTSHRIYYPEWQDRPWVSSLDYIWLEHLKEMTLQNGEIRGKYDCRHMTHEERSIGAGLYLFRFSPPDPSRLEEGKVDLRVALDDIKGQETPSDLLIPEKYTRRRLNSLLTRIQALKQQQ